MNLSTEKKKTHEHEEQGCGCQGGEGESGIDWELAVNKYKLSHSEWISRRSSRRGAVVNESD